jgi:hypothetical protein
MFRNIVSFYGENLLAPLPTTRLDDHPLSAVGDCLFNILAATLHIWSPFLHSQTEDEPCCSDSTYWGQERCIQCSGGEAWGKEPLGRPRIRWECNIKMDLQEVGWETWTGLVWLRIGTGGRHLWMRYWTFGLHKMLNMSWLAEDVLTSQEGLSSIEFHEMGWRWPNLGRNKLPCNLTW